MIKTIRAIIAAMLAAIMAFSGITAFAAENTDKLEWYFNEELSTYTYGGEVTVGTNELESSDSWFLYYIFNVENPGFYSLSIDDYNEISWFSFPEKVENGKAYDIIDKHWYYVDEKEFQLVYLEKGENILGVDGYTGEAFDGDELTIEYFGEALESITLENDLIIDYDFYCYNEHSFEIYSDVVYTFSSGKKFKDTYAEGNCDNAPKEGTQSIKIEFLEKYYPVTVNLVDISSIIKDAEISNVENYLTVKEYYDGSYCDYPCYEDLTLTLADNSKVTASINNYGEQYITLPSGTKVYFYFSSRNIDGKTCLIVSAGENIIKSYECNEIKASVSENFNNFGDYASLCVSRSFYWIKQALIDTLECDSLYEFTEFGMYQVADDISLSFDWFFGIFRDLLSLFKYYLG